MTNKTYLYHKPGAVSLQQIAAIRKGFSDLHDLVEANSPQCRERAVALTNLEQAAMWAIKAAVVSDPESVAEAV